MNIFKNINQHILYTRLSPGVSLKKIELNEMSMTTFTYYSVYAVQ